MDEDEMLIPGPMSYDRYVRTHDDTDYEAEYWWRRALALAQEPQPDIILVTPEAFERAKELGWVE